MSPSLKHIFPYAVPVQRILVKNELDRNNPDHEKWLAGFIEAEGNFHLGISDNNKLKLGKAVRLVFTLTQHSRDEVLVKSLIDFFEKGGSFSMRKGGLACDYKMAALDDICNKLIPFLDKYPLYGTKLLNLNLFKQAAEMMKHKEHLTQQGLTKLQAINASMNILDIPSLSIDSPRFC